MPTRGPHWTIDDSLATELEKALQEHAMLRRKRIERRLKKRELGDKEIQVGLKAFHGVCDQWAIGADSAEAILFAEVCADEIDPSLLERISCVLRVYRLVDEVVQGDNGRKQRWIRRSNLALEGQRPIDLMTSGPMGNAKVMEYLEFCQNGHSS